MSSPKCQRRDANCCVCSPFLFPCAVGTCDLRWVLAVSLATLCTSRFLGTTSLHRPKSRAPSVRTTYPTCCTRCQRCHCADAGAVCCGVCVWVPYTHHVCLPLLRTHWGDAPQIVLQPAHVHSRHDTLGFLCVLPGLHYERGVRYCRRLLLWCPKTNVSSCCGADYRQHGASGVPELLCTRARS